MADDLIIELNSTSIVMTQDSSFDDFLAQFQTSCPKLLTIVNDKQLHYYDKKAELPIGLKFEYKRKNKGRTTYYFRDITNNTYAVFGREAALLFYSRLDDVDHVLLDSSYKNKAIVMSINDSKGRAHTNNSSNASARIIKSKCPTEIVIVDCGQSYSFPYTNFNVEISNHELQ